MYGDSYFQINQGYTYKNASTEMSSYEPHSTPATNPYSFKFHWHYGDLACQIPYNRLYPIWFVTIPGYAFLHSYHYNAEQTERPSKVFPVLIFIVVMAGSLAEELIRVFLQIPIAIGVISFSLSSLFSLLWFWRRREIGDYVKGVYVYVSRSHVSSGASGYRTNSQFSDNEGIPVSVFYPEGQRHNLQPVYEGPRYHVLQRQPYTVDTDEGGINQQINTQPVRWRRHTSTPNQRHTTDVIIPLSQETQV
ncbi:uncharacterized protein LOC142356347 [Convolutriloba macropyga]|uniref:uncharacterized protein LOC142356347 n=1 Tax=Convolutriloba macropyga TaxID=536237 RepID=UPI003F527B6C